MAGKESIVVVGQGYVGTPLTVALAKTGKYNMFGYDINQTRIEELIANTDSTDEVTTTDLESTDINFTTQPNVIKESDYVIMAIPTPVDLDHNPNYIPLIKASQTVGEYLKPGAIVTYESTVDPGATEEFCIPELEKISNLKEGSDFHVAYSPERINPGDKLHRVDTIPKVVGSNNPEITDLVATMFDSFMDKSSDDPDLRGGVHKVSSIMVAEASKIIENTYRDINIAVTNEVHLICQKLGIDTEEVLAAAATKWNFTKYSPGLVGGHCIGVDPYFLARRAKQLGIEPKVILGGRTRNDEMHNDVVDNFGKSLQKQKILLADADVVLLGASFKPNVPDLRNSKTPDVAYALRDEWGANVAIYDPKFETGHKLFNGFHNVSLEDAIQSDMKLLLQPHDELLDLMTAGSLTNVYDLVHNKKLN